MTDEKLTRLLRRFAVAAKAHHEALEAMDEEHANLQTVVVQRLYAEIVRYGDEGRLGLFALVESESAAVAGMAAVFSMRRYPERCTEVLRSIAGEPGLMGFRARVALDRWESGEWELD